MLFWFTFPPLKTRTKFCNTAVCFLTKFVVFFPSVKAGMKFGTSVVHYFVVFFVSFVFREVEEVWYYSCALL